jgi:hypothetical protein
MGFHMLNKQLVKELIGFKLNQAKNVTRMTYDKWKPGQQNEMPIQGIAQPQIENALLFVWVILDNKTA